MKLVRATDEPLEASQKKDRAIQMADQPIWDCDAGSVANVALKHFENGRRDDLWTLKPLYFRPSAAEEMRMARMNTNG